MAWCGRTRPRQASRRHGPRRLPIGTRVPYDVPRRVQGDSKILFWPRQTMLGAPFFNRSLRHPARGHEW
eukprot:1115082-Pyramimonas_sp.AAC.1